MHDVGVAKPALNRTVVTVVKRKPAAMSEPMGVDGEWHCRAPTDPVTIEAEAMAHAQAKATKHHHLQARHHADRAQAGGRK